MIITGNLQKMAVEYASPVLYRLNLADTSLALNAFLGQSLQIRYLGEIYCVHCKRKTAKSFHQGFCFPCYRLLLECNLCTIHPEKCRFYEGNCQQDNWAHAHCGQPHVVYIANSSGLKVGVTRASHVPMRWIDQGATQGLVVYKMQNRVQAGLIEVALKAHMADKTDWRKMLTSENTHQDLLQSRDMLLSDAQIAITTYLEKFAGEIIQDQNAKPWTLQYPVMAYPKKIVSFNLDKNPVVEGVLQGIKGQYLIFDTGVISIRKFAGYRVELQVYGSIPIQPEDAGFKPR